MGAGRVQDFLVTPKTPPEEEPNEWLLIETHSEELECQAYSEEELFKENDSFHFPKSTTRRVLEEHS